MMYAQPGTPFFPGTRGVFVTLLEGDCPGTASVVVELGSMAEEVEFIVEGNEHVGVLGKYITMLVVVVGIAVANIEVEIVPE